MKKLNIILMLVILTTMMVISVNALTCNPNSVTQNIFTGDTATSQSFTCQNPTNSSVNLYQLDSIFQMSVGMPLTIPSNSNSTFTMSFSQMNNPGLYQDSLFSSDGLNIPVKINVTQQYQPGVCGLDVFPLSLSNVKISTQDVAKTRFIQISVPSCFKSPIKINSVILQTDQKPIELGELNLGNIQPGDNLQIPINLDASNIATGTYSDQLQILAYDSNGTKLNIPTISISVIATAGISAIDNNTFVKPSCTLAVTNINVNSTYALVCTNVNNNIKISPDYSEYYYGIKTDYSSGVFTWTYQPTKIGTTILSVHFLVDGSQVFEPFTQSVNILPTGLNTNGNVLELVFFQNGQRIDSSSIGLGNITFLVQDKASSSTIQNFQVHLNGDSYNDTHLNIEMDKVYYLMIDSPGYSTLDLNLSANVIPIDFTITPQKDLYTAGDMVTLNSSISNVTYLANDIVIANPSNFYLPAGNITIKSVKEGFLSTNKTISVDIAPSVMSYSPIKGDWNSGTKVIGALNKYCSWSVYEDNVLLNQGNGTQLDFQIKNIGTITMKCGDRQIDSYTLVNKFVIWNPLTWSLWMWIVAIVLIIFVGIMIMRSKGKNKEHVDFS